MDGLTYETTGVKASKAKNIKATAKKNTVKGIETISGYTLTWILVKRLVKFLWTNKVPLTVNAFLLENAYILEQHYRFFVK